MIDFNIETNLFGSEVLSFLLPLDDDRVSWLVADYRLEYDFGVYYIAKVEDEVDEDGVALKKIIAEANWMRLADRKKPGTVIIGGTVEEGLTTILDGSGWTIDGVNTSATVYNLEMTDSNVLALIWQWAKVTGNEASFNTISKTVKMVETIGANTGYSFRWAKNIKSIKRTVIPPKATRLYAFGKNDLSISSLTSGGVPYIEDYSYYTDNGMTLPDAQDDYRKDEMIVDTTFIEAQPLYDMAVRRLAVLAAPQVLYEANVIDLATLVGYNEASFKVGDTVWVEGEPIAASERARVSRRVVYPYEPERGIVELAFNPILIPDQNQSSSRSDQSLEWNLFESRISTDRQVREGSTILNRIRLRTSAEAEWIVNYTIEGTIVGTGTLTIEAVDDETSEALWPSQTFDVADGEHFAWQFSYGEKEIAQGTHTMAIRAFSSGAGVGINIPAKQSAFWILARAALRENVVLPNSIRYDYTGAIQTFEVPDDVVEVLAELHGASGLTGGHNSIPGLGQMLRLMLPATGGDIWDVIVGGLGNAGPAPAGGWPNGGRGGDTGSNSGGPGGGSSDVRPTGTTMSSTFACAGAGGSPGEARNSGDASMAGGDGGFYTGTQGQDTTGALVTNPGTQSAPGDGGSGGFAGGEGAFNQGGQGRDDGNAFRFGGGGAGGGYNGGEGGQSDSVAGGEGIHGPVGGAGGCGFAHSSAWDLEYEDGENNGEGYIIISWETPDA